MILLRRVYSRYSGGRSCYIPVVWDTSCSKSIISEESVRGLGVHIEELGKSLNIISASGDTLSIVGTAHIFIKTQVTGPRKKMIQCCVLMGNKQASEILVKALRIIHESFGSQTIDECLLIMDII